ncbi:MAG: BT_3928 family protein, partial [Bacteroidales bacterium]
MKYLRIISRIITGLVFIFSGTIKAIDPLGSAYKFGDYFEAFGLGFLQPLALPLAILLCTAEFFAGVSLLTGFRQKPGIWLTVLLMGLFTPLTLVLAISNPVSDCGCFGDAIHLTNWQTFGKNLVLLAFVIILFSGRKHIKPVSGQATEWVAMSFISLLFIAFSLANLRYLPLIDFLPYRVGANIPENMTIPEGKPVDEYKTTFIYEKDGIKKEFSLDNYPEGDSTWKFIDQKSILVKKGYTPPVHDFSITSPGGEDITGKILDNGGYTLLMISVKLEKAARKRLEEGFALRGELASGGIDFYVISASGTEENGVYKDSTGIY